MSSSRILIPVLLAAALVVPGLAAAVPDESVTVTISQPDGAFVATKRSDVFLEGNPDDPFPGDGKNTFVYTITNDPTSPLPLVSFQLTPHPDAMATLGAGFIAGTGIEPVSVDIQAFEVEWNFQGPDDLIDPGETSAPLFVVSEFGPGSEDDNVVSIDGALSFDASGACLGPQVAPPQIRDPLPCTIGYWKNRAAGKQGTLQHFSDAELDAIVAGAVALSGGLFADAADLLANLGSKGKRTIEERGKQQLAATLMNLAAGTTLPDNQKCRLFNANLISSNACGDAISVGDAVAQALADVAGDNAAQHDAQECSDDINNGVGIDD